MHFKNHEHCNHSTFVLQVVAVAIAVAVAAAEETMAAMIASGVAAAVVVP